MYIKTLSMSSKLRLKMSGWIMGAYSPFSEWKTGLVSLYIHSSGPISGDTALDYDSVLVFSLGL